ncbi:MAG: hypothetical protein HIU81_08100 [Acidobacteria bacterium]|nr:hypothetical protein [Acidobacteriota bacterium]
MSTVPQQIAVLVGTDRHPYTRIVDWADRWATDHPEDSVFVQHGFSQAPQVAQGRDFVTPQELSALLQGSTVAIMHGGPATISDARKAGHLPIVVPRDPQFGEHVDDHQQRFSRWAQERQLVTCIESTSELNAQLTQLSQTPTGTRLGVDGENSELAQTAHRLQELLEQRRNFGNRASSGAPTVLYLVGEQENLLEQVFPGAGNRSDVAVLGNSRMFWRAALAENAPCSCGVGFSGCEFWQAVGKAAFDGWNVVDLAVIESLRLAVESGRSRLLAEVSAPVKSLRQDVAHYTDYYRALYSGIRKVSGAEVLVDAAGDAGLALALSQNKEIDLRFLSVHAGRRARISASELAVGATMARHGVPHAVVRPSSRREKARSASWVQKLGFVGSLGEPTLLVSRTADRPALGGHQLATAGNVVAASWRP